MTLSEEQKTLIAKYNEAARRSRLEYRRHPWTGRGEHGSNCAAWGCPEGLAVVAKEKR